MKTLILFFAITLFPLSGSAQWKKIADFPNYEYVTYVYFIDHPGPPRVGFVGTTMGLYKTTDGGANWYSVCSSGVTGICFKDSLTGWFSTNGASRCYRTTDGGETWEALNVPGTYAYSTYGVFYSSVSNKLFLLDSVMKVSPDLGNLWGSWKNYYPISLSFWSDSHFILLGFTDVIGPEGDTEPLVFLKETLDGGVTWDTVAENINGLGIFPITGTSSCYSANNYSNANNTGEWIEINRSDDFARTWYLVAKIPSNQICTGVIEGDFSRLTMQTDSGMYVSIDSGLTWNFVGGPSYIAQFSNDFFYSAKGITIAGKTYSDGGIEGEGLWEEIWSQSGVAENKPSASTLRVFPNPATSSITIASPAGPVAVYDPLGRKCAVPTKGTTLDVSGLPPGIYFATDGVSHVKLVKE